jgi:cysteine desulfurase/selenocysteine lyase
MHPAAVHGSYAVARIHDDFSILNMRVHGTPLAYLDNGASAQKPTAVLNRLNDAYTSEYANVRRGLHSLANAAAWAYEGARKSPSLSQSWAVRGDCVYPQRH